MKETTKEKYWSTEDRVRRGEFGEAILVTTGNAIKWVLVGTGKVVLMIFQGVFFVATGLKKRKED